MRLALGAKPKGALSALTPKTDICSAQAHVCFGSKADIRRKKGMSALSPEVEIYSTVADVCYGQNQKFRRLLPNIGTMGQLDIRGVH